MAWSNLVGPAANLAQPAAIETAGRKGWKFAYSAGPSCSISIDLAGERRLPSVNLDNISAPSAHAAIVVTIGTAVPSKKTLTTTIITAPVTN